MDTFTSTFNSDPIAAAVYSHWLATGEPSTVKTIAKTTNMAESSVRRAIRKRSGFIDGCVPTDAVIDVCDTNYGSVISQRRVDAWEPSKSTLRKVIAAQRARIGELDRQLRPDVYLEGRDAAETNVPH